MKRQLRQKEDSVLNTGYQLVLPMAYIFLPVYFQADKHRGFEGCHSGAEVPALQNTAGNIE